MDEYSVGVIQRAFVHFWPLVSGFKTRRFHRFHIHHSRFFYITNIVTKASFQTSIKHIKYSTYIRVFQQCYSFSTLYGN